MTPRPFEDAAAQLGRLLLAIPLLADERPRRLDELAEAIGVDPVTLARDLRSVVTRLDEGAPGWTESVRLLFDRESVQLHSHHFRRPMGLTRGEWRALELGLAMQQQELPADRQAIAEAARRRIRKAALALRDASDPHTTPPPRGAALTPAEVSTRQAGALLRLRRAIRRQRAVVLRYRSAHADAVSERTVHPYGLLFARGHWFLVAHCERAGEVRVFRADRMAAVTVGSVAFQPPAPGFSLEGALADGRVLLTASPDLLRVRYAPRIARWILEREGGEPEPDGAVIREYPLADEAWAVRHVLQYGPDAEVLAPERVRMAVRARLEAIAGVRTAG